MSNVIKSRFVYLNDKKVIDSNERSEQFRLLNFADQLKSYSVSEEAVAEEEEDGFKEGLNYTVIEKETPEETENKAREKCEQLLKNAKDEAERMLEEAKVQAEEMGEGIREEARNLGYQEGLLQAEAEIANKKQELEEIAKQQNLEYLCQLQSMEPRFGDFIVKILEKLTGVLVEEKKDVIVHLIHNSILNGDNSKEYIIRVSKEDYDYVLSKLDDIRSLVREDTVLEVSMDKGLGKNQCLIETDGSIIDCSLDVQLANLIQDIRLLSLQND